MSSKLKPLDLTGAGVGFTGSIDFNQFVKSAPYNPSLRPGQQPDKARIRLLNESGCGLDIVFQASGNSHSLPAGGWGTFDIEANDGAVQATVTYILPNPPVSLLLAMYYGPGEQVPGSFTLGNSPIGIGGTVNTSSVQTLSNELNAINTQVIDIGDAALANLWRVFTDHFIIKVDQSSVAHTVLQGQTSGNPLLIGQTGDTSEVLGALLVDQTLEVTGATDLDSTLDVFGASTLDNGTITSSGAGALTVLSLIAKFINLAPTSVQVSGQAGTATLYQFMQGTIKAFLIQFSGWQDNSGTRKNLVLPTAFTQGGIGLIGGIQASTSGIYFKLVNTAEATNQVTGRNAAINGTTQNQSFEIIEVPNAPFDTVQIDANTASVANGFVFFIGI